MSAEKRIVKGVRDVNYDYRMLYRDTHIVIFKYMFYGIIIGLISLSVYHIGIDNTINYLKMWYNDILRIIKER